MVPVSAGGGVGAACCTGGAGAGGGGAGCASTGFGAGGSAAAPGAPSSTATTVLTSTVSPSLNLTSVNVPAAGDGISASTLSVEISKRGSSRSTRSPSFFNHFVIVPSAMDSPICGITTSVLILSPGLFGSNSVGRQLSRCFNHILRLRQVIIFERGRIRHRRIDRCNTDHRSVQPFKSFFCKHCSNLPADASGA